MTHNVLSRQGFTRKRKGKRPTSLTEDTSALTAEQKWHKIIETEIHFFMNKSSGKFQLFRKTEMKDT